MPIKSVENVHDKLGQEVELKPTLVIGDYDKYTLKPQARVVGTRMFHFKLAQTMSLSVY